MSSSRCPYCQHELSSERVFDLVNQVMAQRASNCQHFDMEDSPNDPTLQICNDCGLTVETTRPI